MEYPGKIVIFRDSRRIIKEQDLKTQKKKPERQIAEKKKTRKPARGVIFDMDGVLIDSEPLQMKVFNVMMKKRGISMPLKEFIGYVGMKAVDNFRDIIRKYRLRATPEELVIEKNGLYREVLRGPLRPMPGIRQLLETLKKAGIPIALVSGSNGRDVRLVLKGLGLAGYFPTVVSGDDVRRGKPHPEGFLKAARLLNLDPAGIFILEDSSPGTIAGKRGGFRVLAVPTRFTKSQDFSSAERSFMGYRTVKRFLESEFRLAGTRGQEEGRSRSGS